MIDFHSHILPGVDDGATDLATSLEMLRISAASGVDTIVATSHYYPSYDHSVEDFLKKRDDAFHILKTEMKMQKEPLPSIIMGAEVHISKGIARLESLNRLCIEDTNYILLEMPYEKWTDEIFEEIYQITLNGLRPILAHIDRYISQEKKFEELFSLNVLFQMNASAFLDKSLRKKAISLFANDALHVIGSDMHNLTTRPPNLAQAYNIIQEKFGWEYVDYLKHNSERITKNKEALPTRLPKLGFMKKLKI